MFSSRRRLPNHSLRHDQYAAPPLQWNVLGRVSDYEGLRDGSPNRLDSTHLRGEVRRLDACEEDDGRGDLDGLSGASDRGCSVSGDSVNHRQDLETDVLVMPKLSRDSLVIVAATRGVQTVQASAAQRRNGTEGSMDGGSEGRRVGGSRGQTVRWTDGQMVRWSESRTVRGPETSRFRVVKCHSVTHSDREPQR